MRTAPVALAYLDDPTALAHAARAVSELTHGDPQAGDACVIWSEAIRQAVIHGSFDGLRDGVEFIPESRRDWWQLMIDIADLGDPELCSDNGLCVTALQAAWSSIRHTPVPDEDPARGSFACDHLRDALNRAIRVGGDTDTVAAIAGTLLGARWGISGIPLGWQREVHGWPGRRSADLVDAAVQIINGGAQHGRWPMGDRMATPVSQLLNTAHPDDPGVILGNPGHDGRAVDAVVSLCQVSNVQFPSVHRAEQVRVWLVDQPGATLNPAFAADQAARMVATLRAEGKRVLLHCTAGQSRTAAVAARYASIVAGYDGTTAVDRVHRALAAHGAVMNTELATVVAELAPGECHEPAAHRDSRPTPRIDRSTRKDGESKLTHTARSHNDPLGELRVKAEHSLEARGTLARELSNRSLALGEQDRADEALACAGEAVMHYRHLVAEDPDRRCLLAQALSNWAVALDRLERHDEARAALTEAVAIHRASADSGPGRRDLAIALTNLALNLVQERVPEEGIAPAWEAVALLRGLLQTGEGDDATVSNLGAALANYSNALHAAGRDDEASAQLTEALQMAHEHCDPADPPSLVGYAQLLHNLGIDRGDEGSVDEAFALLGEAESLLATAAEAEPGYRWMAAQTGFVFGVRLAEAGRPAPARDAFARVVRWRRALVADDPDRYAVDLARALRNLSGTHESLAAETSELGDRQAHTTAALTAQSEAVPLMRDVSCREPRRRGEFAETLLEYADLLDTADRHAEATAARAEAPY